MRCLLWVEYAHNTLPSSAAGLSPFQCSRGYQPPLFPEQEREASVPSVQMFIRRCRCTWLQARSALLRSSDRYQRGAHWHHIPEPHLARRFGGPLMTSHSGWSPESWLGGLWVLFPSPRSLTLLQSVSAFPGQ